MVYDSRWLVPYIHFNPRTPIIEYLPYLEKPPLVMWFQAIFILIFGKTELAVRFPSASAALLTAPVVYAFGRALVDRRAGFLAGLVFLTTPMVFRLNNAGRTGGVDTAFMFFGTVFLFLTWLIATRRADYYGLLGLAGAAVVLTKGVAGGLFVLIALPLVLRHYARFLTRSFAKTLGVVALFTLPWVVAMYLAAGSDFVQIMIVEQAFGRVQGEFATYSGAFFSFMHYPYFKQLLYNPSFYQPWIFGLLPAIGVSIYGSFRSDNVSLADFAFISWWVVFVPVFFALTGNHPWYLLPMAPAGALLFGYMFREASVGSSYGFAGVAISLLSLLVAPRVISRFDSKFTNDPIVVTVLVGAVVGLLLLSQIKSILQAILDEYDYRMAEKVLPVIVALVFIVAVVGTPPQMTYQSEVRQAEKAIGITANENVPPKETLYVLNKSFKTTLRPMAFYANRPIRGVSMTQINSNRSIDYLLVLTGSLQYIQRDYTVLTNVSANGMRNASVIRLSNKTA